MDFNETFRQRSKAFVVEVVKFCATAPKTDESRVILRQLLRSASSVGANFRAACRGRSKKEYFAKLSIVVEECDESLFWMEVLEEAGIDKSLKLKKLQKENTELLLVFSKLRKNAKIA